MKLRETVGTVSRGGEAGESRDFQIQASAKAFQVLSSSLYSDKIRAVLRELGTNAFDSHVDAGNASKPFDVHLPTRLEPLFYVRDYGTGLTHDKAMELYRTYFGSDKTHTNDADGCLGLGSKSPLAYTDNFTVESYVDGTANVYFVYLGERGTPQLEHKVSFETDEPNGVKITVAVDNKDIEEFEEKAKSVYYYFSTRPNIMGVNWDWESFKEWDFQGDGYRISKKYWNTETHSYVVMGNVAYRLDQGAIKAKGELGKVADILLSHGVTLWVDRGDVDFLPSREGLQYNQWTLKFLRKRFNEIGEKLRSEINDQINAFSTLWEARLFAATSLNDSVLSRAAAASAEKESFTWNGIELWAKGIPTQKRNHDGTLVFDRFVDRTALKELAEKEAEEGNTEVFAWALDARQIEYTSLVRVVACSKNYSRRRRTAVTEENILTREDRDYLPVYDGVTYIIDDGGESRPYSRISQQMGSRDAFFIRPMPGQDMDEWLKASGIEDIAIKLSDCPAPLKTIAAKKKKTAKVVQFDSSSYGKVDKWDDYEIEDMDEGGVYVQVNRFDWKCEGLSSNFQGPDELVSVLNNMHAIGIPLPTIMGVRTASVKKFEKNGNWETLSDYLRRKLDDIYTAEVMDEVSHYRAALSMTGSLTWRQFELMRQALEDAMSFDNHKLRLISDKWKPFFSATRIEKIHQWSSGVYQFSGLITNSLTDRHDELAKIIEEWSQALNEYPMLQFINWGFSMSHKENTDKVLEYIQLVDKAEVAEGGSCTVAA